MHISSVIVLARTSRAPRKMPGKPSELLTWLGKSERPGATILAPASLASQGQKYHVRKVSQSEALTIIRDARARGCITAAWFKVATGGRTGVICSCCACCCGGMEGARSGQKFDETLSMMAPSGYSVVHASSRCRLGKV